MSRARVLAALLLAVTPPLAAQDEGLGVSLDPAEAIAFWTPERAANTQPIPWPALHTKAKDQQPDRVDEAPAVEQWGQPPGLGTQAVAPDPNSRLFEPAHLRSLRSAAPEKLDSVSAKDVGSAKGHFSSSRLLPLEADLVYPYRAVGKLLFEIPGKGPASCTAAVIAKRVILTAGHCVHSGTPTPGFFTKFVFVPAFRDGAAPYGSWPATYGLVTTTWSTGQGKLPNAADYAVLELDDITLSDGLIHRIGDVVGWFGLLTGALQANHITMLGYPANLDKGNKMHQVTASTLKYDKKANVAVYGSDMMQGSSGGPWIQNFGLPAVGQVVSGGTTMLNRIVGITSFGSTSPLPKAANSSVPDARLASMYAAICGHRAGNC